MDLKKIKALADILNGKNLTSLELEEGDSRIRIERTIKELGSTNQGYHPVQVEEERVSNIEKDLQQKTEEKTQANNLMEVKSPMVGVFYAAPSPDSPPFVKIGDRVKKGDVICVIESMKLMNDITSDVTGEIIDICVNNGDVVEFSQPLFKII